MRRLYGLELRYVLLLLASIAIWVVKKRELPVALLHIFQRGCSRQLEVLVIVVPDIICFWHGCDGVCRSECSLRMSEQDRIKVEYRA